MTDTGLEYITMQQMLCRMPIDAVNVTPIAEEFLIAVTEIIFNTQREASFQQRLSEAST